MISRRSDFSPRIISSQVVLHLACGLLYFWRAEGVTWLNVLLALVVMYLPAMTFGRLAGLISGLFFSVVMAAKLILQQFSAAADTFSPLTILQQALEPQWPLLAALPLLGFLLGMYAEWFGIRRPEGAKRLRLLKERNSQLETQLKILSTKPVYFNTWSSLQGQNPLNERLLGLLAATKIRGDARGDVYWASDSNQQLFNEYIRIRPEVLAVLELDGTILQANNNLLAIYGYPPASEHQPANIKDLLLPADNQAAAAFMERLLTLGRGTSELLKITPPSANTRLTTAAATAEEDARAESYNQLLISPSIYLECLGSPLTLVAAVNINSAFALNTDNHSAFAELAKQPFFCLAPDNTITYLNDTASQLLNSEDQEPVGQHLERLLSWRHAAVVAEIEQECRAGNTPVREVELLPRNNARRIMQISAFPALTESRRYLGCTLLLKEVTSLRLMDEALQHRLALEQMSSKISARFISVEPDDLDEAVIAALKNIGDFEGVIQTSIEIFQTKRIKNPVNYTVVNARGEAKQAADAATENGWRANSDPFETVSIAIAVAGETAGHFRFLKERYHEDTFEQDLDLIRLIGEIIINALLRKQGILEIRFNESRLASTIQALNEGVIATDPSGKITLMNQMAEKLTGWTAAEAQNRLLAEVFRTEPASDPDEPSVVAELYPLSETDDSLVLISRDGSRYNIRANSSEISHELSYYGNVTVFRDITREKMQNDQIRRVSYNDILTGLYNRTFFEEILARLNTPRQYPISLIMGDCNDLKAANDNYGHLVGDRLLQTIANILKKATRHEDIVARWGGDEFTIILSKTDAASCLKIKERIKALCAAAPADPIQPSLAIGCATNTAENIAPDNMEALLQLAEKRMYEDKRERNGNGFNR